MSKATKYPVVYREYVTVDRDGYVLERHGRFCVPEGTRLIRTVTILNDLGESTEVYRLVKKRGSK